MLGCASPLVLLLTKTKTCTVADKKPKTKTLKIVGDATYRTQAEAESGMKFIVSASRRTRQRGPDIPAGSNRSSFHNIRSATAIAARLADPECSSPEGGG
jgi:hypothetical protein